MAARAINRRVWVPWLLALACVLAGPAGAAAAPGWTAAPLSAGGAVAVTGLDFAADGTGVLTWESIAAGRKRTQLAVRPPGGAWRVAGDLPGVTWGLARVHVVGARTVLVGMRAYAFGAYHRARWEVVTATGRLDGSFGAVRVLARDVRWVESAAGRGQVFAAWTARRDDALRVARVLPAGGAPSVVSPPAVGRATLAAGPRGELLCTWLRTGRLEVRMRVPEGAWTPIRRVATAGPVPSVVDAAVGADGRALLSWGVAIGDESHPPRWYFRAATASARETWARWTTHRLAAFSGSPGPAAPPQTLAAFAGSRGLVAWTTARAVTLARPDGSDRQLLPVAAGTSLDALAVSRRGELAILFSAPTPAQGPGPGPYVATTAPDGALRAPVDLGAAGMVPLVAGKLAFDPVAAQANVAWLAVEHGAGRVWTAARDPLAPS
jgi:hypothetical protein